MRAHWRGGQRSYRVPRVAPSPRPMASGWSRSCASGSRKTRWRSSPMRPRSDSAVWLGRPLVATVGPRRAQVDPRPVDVLPHQFDQVVLAGLAHHGAVGPLGALQASVLAWLSAERHRRYVPLDGGGTLVEPERAHAIAVVALVGLGGLED